MRAGRWRGSMCQGLFDSSCSVATVGWLLEKVYPYGGMYLPPYFFLPQHIIFSKNIVLWQVCHYTLLFEPQHIIFFKYCVVARMSQHITF